MSRCLVCVSLAARSLSTLQSRLVGLGEVDVAEVRLDALADPTGLGVADLAALVSRSPVPLLMTCRPDWEGGGFSGPEPERRELMVRALAAGARFIDLEIDATWAADLVGRWRDRVLLSHHWDCVLPPELDVVVDALIRLRPAVAKLVARAELPHQAAPLLAAANRLRDAGIGTACFCMGEAGRSSRMLAAARGDRITYATGATGYATAPGQWPLWVLRRDLLASRWKPGDAIYGVAGDPIDQSLSPLVFNSAFAASNTDALYLPLPGGPFESVLELAREAGVRGLSVTMPYKQDALQACRDVSRLARRIGAVNTLVWSQDGWQGHNTDGPAVAQVLAGRVQLDASRCAILGAGGAARAAVVALADRGASVTVLNRTVPRARALADELGCGAGPLEALAAERFDIVINATPVGMGRTVRTPVSTAWLKGDEIVLDMVYGPPQTEFLRQARERGCRTVSGLEMFLRQAALQYELWTGLHVPAEVMRTAAESRLAESGSTVQESCE